MTLQSQTRKGPGRAANTPKKPGRLPGRNLLGRYRQDLDGSTAVEFGIVAAPFFALLFAIFETAFVFFGELMLESGLQDAARMVRTGQAQEGGFDENAFRQAVCDNALGLITCGENLFVDVRAFDDFNEVVIPPPLNEDGELSEDFIYNHGTQGSTIVARAFYTWHLLTPMIGTAGLGNMASGDRLMTSIATFRNEPFGGGEGE
jgi:Flp pilus assembly protein TadG